MSPRCVASSVTVLQPPPLGSFLGVLVWCWRRQLLSYVVLLLSGGSGSTPAPTAQSFSYSFLLFKSPFFSVFAKFFLCRCSASIPTCRSHLLLGTSPLTESISSSTFHGKDTPKQTY